MGAQIILCDGFEVIPPPGMTDLILYGGDESGGSNGDESTVTTEEDSTGSSGDSSPGGAAEDEWPETKGFSFYIVKQPACDDSEIQAKIHAADTEIYQCNKNRIDISAAQKTERAEVSSLFAQMESLVPKSEGYNVVFEEKKMEFDTLQEALRNLRCSTSDQLCFSQEELDHLIYVAHYVIEHGSIGFEEEDWVLKETGKKTTLSEVSLAQKDASIHRLKAKAVELHGVKNDLDAITWNMSYLRDKVGKVQGKIRALGVELARVLEKRDKCYERIKMLRIQRDKKNSTFFKSTAAIRKAKELAASGNIRDLEVFARSEVDGFMIHWNHDKAFRDDYVKRLSNSLCERQLSRDGRISDPEAHVVQGKQAPVQTGKESAAVHMAGRDDSSSNSSQNDDVITGNRKKEARRKEVDINRSSSEESDVIDPEFPVYENSKNEEVEEEEECEKKAKKKAAANTSSTAELYQSGEVMNEMEKVRTLAVSGKERHQKERSMFPKQRSFRYKHRGRGTEALPKAILNRRKAQKYWIWGLSSAALAVVLVLGVLLLR
ncbi:unnamed protein product [Thlaspi arvense]|uniref:Proton pump-interactor 1 n=1 Tax=Thlaspi arvense TaxID=13288 RepID=A0AAU9S2L2_THLAR|nr:unnamed protein product [Thlaspi arvense]